MRAILYGIWRFAAALRRPSKHRNARRLRARGESLDTLILRDLTAADIPRLAALHVTVWNATYAPLLLKGPDEGVREWQWRDAWERAAPGWFCLILERPDGQLVGFVEGRRSDHPDFGGEVRKIYLRADYQRLGLGRRLLAAAAARFVRQGITSMWLVGDARNPSRGAWVALGAEKLEADPGSGNYGWRNLSALVPS